MLRPRKNLRYGRYNEASDYDDYDNASKGKALKSTKHQAFKMRLNGKLEGGNDYPLNLKSTRFYKQLINSDNVLSTISNNGMGLLKYVILLRN